MVQLFGRITKDASVTEIKSGKKVVNFSIALNDSFKNKDGEVVKRTTYVNCACWFKPENAVYLTKGKLVEVAGRLSVSAYSNMNGEAIGTINFHVNQFKLYGKGNAATGADPAASGQQAEKANQTADDLPF